MDETMEPVTSRIGVDLQIAIENASKRLATVISRLCEPGHYIGAKAYRQSNTWTKCREYANEIDTNKHVEQTGFLNEQNDITTFNDSALTQLYAAAGSLA